MTDLDLIREAIETVWRNEIADPVLSDDAGFRLHGAIPAFHRALAKYVRCERPNTCCELGYHSKERQDDPGQTHYMVACGECDGCLLLKIVEEK